MKRIYLRSSNTSSGLSRIIIRLFAAEEVGNADNESSREKEATERRIVSYDRFIASELSVGNLPEIKVSLQFVGSRITLDCGGLAVLGFDRVREQFLVVFQLCSSKGWRSELIQLCQSLHQFYFLENYAKDALIPQKLMLEASQQTLDEANTARAYFYSGTTYANLSNADESIKAFEAAIEMFGRLHLENESAIASSAASLSYMAANRPGAAVESATRAISSFEDYGDVFNEGNALNNLGGIYESQKEYDKAAACYERSATCLEGRSIAAHPLTNIGRMHLRQGSSEKAVPFLERAQSKYEASHNWPARGSALDHLATAYAATGDEDGLSCSIVRRVETCTAQSDTSRMSRMLADLGDQYVAIDRIDDAIVTYIESLKNSYSSRSTAALVQIMPRDRLSEIIPPLTEALQVVLRSHEQGDIAMVTAEVAGVLNLVGRTSEAATMFETAAASSLRLGTEPWRDALISTALELFSHRRAGEKVHWLRGGQLTFLLTFLTRVLVLPWH